MGRTAATVPVLELDDIQSGVLRPRPTPFAATYIIVRIDDRNAGRELMRRLSTVVASAAHHDSPARDTWVSVALSFQGLRALGVPQNSLDSFPPAFREGMAVRAKMLGDVGENSPEHWENPLPLKMRLQGLSRFVVTRGGEYCFLPGLRALSWLAELKT